MMKTFSRSKRRASIKTAAFAVGAAVLPVSIALAQVMGMPGLDATEPLGQSAPAATDPASDAGGEIPPSFTAAQVERGRADYIDACADCHGDQLNNGEFGGAPLKGSYFDARWGGLPVSALYGFMASAMPPNRPGSLSPQTYSDITAFILSRNGFQATGQELPTDLEALNMMVIKRE